MSGLRNGPSSKSRFLYPRGLCLDRERNLLVADCSNHVIRRIEFAGGIVSTVAGSKMGFENGDALVKARFRHPSSLVIRNDIIYVCDSGNRAIREIRNGMVSTLAVEFVHPRGIAVDTNGNILVADEGGNRIKRIHSDDGSTFTLPRSIECPIGITVASNGNIYVSTCHGFISYWNGDGWDVLSRGNQEIWSLRADSLGNLIFTQRNCIRKMNLSSGGVSTFAGSALAEVYDGGSLSEAIFDWPMGIVMDDSTIYVSDNMNHTIRRISLLGPWNKGKPPPLDTP